MTGTVIERRRCADDSRSARRRIFPRFFTSPTFLVSGPSTTSPRCNPRSARLSLARLIFVFWVSHSVVRAADWKPAAGPLMTRWAKDVSPEKSHPEYPRPQMVRSTPWIDLNGLWDYAIRPTKDDRPRQFDGSILVPFPIESALSGVMRRISPEQRLWYRRSFSVPQASHGNRILLHFDAVDWEAAVWIDQKRIGVHRGGYSPFTFDVSDAVVPGKRHDLIVSVWDPSDSGTQPRGKQVLKPRGSRYTPTTGIWQTVWLETVGQAYFRDISLEPDAAGSKMTVATDLAGPTAACVVTAEIEIDQQGGSKARRTRIAAASGHAGKTLTLSIPPGQVRPWSPETPFLYDIEVRLTSRDGQVLDAVKGYFALRSIAVSRGPDVRTSRILLNGKPIFLIGPLDQGFWPDGLYTAATDEAMRFDLETIKRLGFNLVRKHVKIEPARWYYWCDRLGLVVFQDMPNGDQSSRKRSEIKRSVESARQFDAELKEMIDSRRQFPCIVAWVAFNEGWGQFDTVRVSRWIKDPRSKPPRHCRQRVERLSGRRHPRHPRLSRAVRAARRSGAGGRFGGIRRARLASFWTFMGGQEELGLLDVHKPGNADCGVPASRDEARASGRLAAVGRSLYADDRYRDRSERLDDIRPRVAQNGRSQGARGQQAADRDDSRALKPPKT